MRLKSLELHGFKSFPEKTTIGFDHGVTAIIGPNGSGKSNISDAVRWVLGELSSKSMRGSKMEDVIFGGSDKRRQMSFAEVSLTIDNTDVDNRMAIDFDEVIITRRYYRSGESEYMINRKPAKLRDIVELFMNTGVGKTGYSIIGQGRVADIISQRGDDRRGIFEEAAGIAKFRYKKNEAEKRLSETGDNITRINDILSDLTTRLEPLRRDSEKAKKYLELYELKKREDVSLALFDISRIRDSLDITERGYIISKHELELADSELESLDVQSEKLSIDLTDSRLGAERSTRLLRENENKRTELSNEIAVLNNDISHLTEGLADTERNLKLRQSAMSDAEKQLNEKEISAKNSGLLLEEREKAYEVVSVQLTQLRDLMTANEGELSRLNTESDNLRDELTTLRLKLSELSGTSHADVDQRTRIEMSLGELVKQLDIYDKRIKKVNEVLSGYAAKGSDIDEEIKKLESSIADIDNKNDKINDTVVRLKLDISSKAQRIDTLKRMEELFEGYNQSVRFVMSASERGELSGICGPVSRIIEVPARYSIAIETALGANIQNIITENEDAATAAIELLKQDNAGRATFYPLTLIRSQPLNINESDIARYKGYIGIASGLVGCENRYREVVGYMLGRTVVFDNLENARIIAKAFGYRVRTVTLDGQLINVGGSFTGGSVKRDSGMLTRGAEIDKLQADITRLNNEVKAYGDKLDEINSAAKDNYSQKEDLIKQRRLIDSIYQAENTQLQVLKSQYSADTARHAELSAELNGLNSSLAEHDAEKSELEKRISELTCKTENNTVLRESISDKAAKLSDEYARCSELSGCQMVALAEARKDNETALRDLSFAKAALDTLVTQLESGAASIDSLKLRISDAENGIAAKNETIEALRTEAGELAANASEYKESIAALEGLSSQIHEKSKEQSKHREELFRENTRLESRLNQLGSENDKLISRLWDDYELTPGGAAELGYPALTEENRPASVSRQSEYSSKLRSLGNVNLGAVDEYSEVSSRHDFLTLQLTDLQKSQNDLIVVIEKLEVEMCTRFLSVFEEVNRNFHIVFTELFGGGRAELSLTDPENVLTSGIEISIAPPGKIIKSLTLLSGGEQAFVAIALLFAILKVTPTPFVIFDEIEAALDEVNVNRFAEYCRRASEHTQFILITHRRGAMEAADMLYGVTMYERGVSNVLMLNVAEAEEKLGLKLGDK